MQRRAGWIPLCHKDRTSISIKYYRGAGSKSKAGCVQRKCFICTLGFCLVDCSRVALCSCAMFSYRCGLFTTCNHRCNHRARWWRRTCCSLTRIPSVLRRTALLYAMSHVRCICGFWYVPQRRWVYAPRLCGLSFRLLHGCSSQACGVSWTRHFA
jgi:hypothetical protein